MGRNMSLLPTDLKQQLAPFLREETKPGNGNYYSIGLEGVRAAAAFLNCDAAAAMVFCLQHNIWPLRFCRNRGLFTALKQAALLQSHVAVIGCGGLGGITITLLARLGIGALTLCDPDVFEESNLNRQVLCREDRLGMNKASAARDELALIASHVKVRAMPVAATADNMPEILQGVDLVIDCLDKIETRRMVALAARRAGIPFVHGAIAGQEGFVMLDCGPVHLFDQAYATRREGDATAEQRLGVPTLTPAATGILQCELAVRFLPGQGQTTQSCAWHLDLSVPEIEPLFADVRAGG